MKFWSFEVLAGWEIKFLFGVRRMLSPGATSAATATTAAAEGFFYYY